MKLSIVIPVYNSSKTIKKVIDEINEVMPTIKSISDYEIILINDCSKDNVLEVCKEICEQMKFVKLINLSRNFGQQNTLMAGFNYVNGDVVVAMDDDYQTPAIEIPKLINELIEKDYDLVFAKYSEIKQSIFRKLGSSINNIMAETLIQKPKGIRINSFFVVRRFVINEILRYHYPYTYLGGLFFRTTQNVGEIQVLHRSREAGTSNYNFFKLIGLWLNGFTSFSVKPLRFASIFGLIISLISMLFAFVILVQVLMFKVNYFNGWPSMMIALSFFSGIQLFSIGLLGEYIGRVFISQNKSPQYVIKEKYNFDDKDISNVDKLKYKI